jgi:hypothetical protein
VDNAWEQEKLEARKMPENGDKSHLSSARFVGWLERKTCWLKKKTFPLMRRFFYFFTACIFP